MGLQRSVGGGQGPARPPHPAGIPGRGGNLPAGRTPRSVSTSYLDWMRSEAARLRNPYADLAVPGTGVAMMRGRLLEAHSDAATSQLSIQLCTAGDYHLTADLGAGRFAGRRLAGDAIVGPAHQPLALSGGSKAGLEITILALDTDRAAALAEGATGRPVRDFGALHARLVRDPALAAIVTAAWHTLSQDGAASRLYAEGVMQTAVATLLRLAQAPALPFAGGLAPAQLTRVMDLLAARYAEDLSIAELAAAVGLSPFHFARAFKASTGRTPHRRQMELRVEHAKRALADPASSITQVALEVGYSSPQVFARVFREMTGLTASQYRRMVADGG